MHINVESFKLNPLCLTAHDRMLILRLKTALQNQPIVRLFPEQQPDDEWHLEAVLLYEPFQLDFRVTEMNEGARVSILDEPLALTDSLVSGKNIAPACWLNIMQLTLNFLENLDGGTVQVIPRERPRLRD